MVVIGGGGIFVDVEFEEDDDDLVFEEDGQVNYVLGCIFILVCIGIFSNSSSALYRNYRDFVIDSELVKFGYITDNVLGAVKYVLEKEKFL